MKFSYVRAWIGVGANLGEPRRQVLTAIDCLDSQNGIEVEMRSSLYQTAPIGELDQPDFINAVVRVITSLDPVSVLHCLLETEDRFGRVRDGSQNDPRRLDLDLLLYADKVIDSHELILPHPRMHKRLFVLEPLAEIEGNFDILGVGSVAACINACRGQRVVKLLENHKEFMSEPD